MVGRLFVGFSTGKKDVWGTGVGGESGYSRAK